MGTSTPNCSAYSSWNSSPGVFITHSISEAVFLSTRVLVMSARPGRIVGDYVVPFPFPRVDELRFEPQFAELCGQISADLKGSHS